MRLFWYLEKLANNAREAGLVSLCRPLWGYVAKKASKTE